MAFYKGYANVYQRALPFVTSGIWAKPAWFDGMRRSPPDIKLKYPAPPMVVFPEDKLYKKLLLDKPLLELETDKQGNFQRTLGHRFAQAQYKYMADAKLPEAEAYQRCEADFAAEIKRLEVSLERHHLDGGRRASFHTIRKNVSQHARVSETIASLLEQRLDVTQGQPFYPDPLGDEQDSFERRRAKLGRLAADPAIGYVRSIFRPPRPAILTALEVLVKEPSSQDAAFYNTQLKAYVQTLGAALYSFDDSQSTDSERAEVQRLKNVLSKISYKVKTFTWAELPPPIQSAVLDLVQAALRMKLAPEADPLSLRVSTFVQQQRLKVMESKERLAVEESERSLREKLGRGYAMYMEVKGFRESGMRKSLLQKVQASKAN